MAGVQPKLTAYGSPSVRTVTGWTIFFLVFLRVAIGWHFLYEGAWKLQQPDWRATGYLANSSGPFRPFFRAMIDDSDGFDRLGIMDIKRDENTGKVVDVTLDPQNMYDRMDERAKVAIDHYGLTPEQQKVYPAFVERKKHGIQDDLNVKTLFSVLEAKKKEEAKKLRGWVPPEKKEGDKEERPPENAQQFYELMKAYEKNKAEGKPVDTAPIKALVQAVFDDLDKVVGEHQLPEQTKEGDLPPMQIVPAGAKADDLGWLTASYLNGLLDKRYNQLRDHYKLDGNKYAADPGKLQELKATIELNHQSSYGWRYRDQKKIGGDRDPNNVAKLFAGADYKLAVIDYVDLCDSIDKVEQDERKTVGRPAIDFDSERLDFDYQKRNTSRLALLSRIEIPLKDIDPKRMQTFGEQVGVVLTQEQLSAGALPPEKSQTWLVDWSNMICLTAIGVCLILGLFTRLAALGGVGMLAMFYFCMPPWPGLEANMTAEGHALIVNKNMVEAIALLVIATSHVGRWWGLDGILGARKMRRVAVEMDEAAAEAEAATATA